MQEYFIRSQRTEQYLTCVRSMDSGNGPCWKCSELCHMLLIAFALPPSPRVRVPSSNGDDENRCQSGQTRLHFNIFTLLCNRLFVEQNDTGVAGSIQLSADGTGIKYVRSLENICWKLLHFEQHTSPTKLTP